MNDRSPEDDRLYANPLESKISKMDFNTKVMLLYGLAGAALVFGEVVLLNLRDGWSWINFLFPVGAVIFGLSSAWSTFYVRVKVRASAKWPVTVGKISSAGIVEEQGAKGGKIYRPEIQYKYSVNGQEYRSELKLNTHALESSAQNVVRSMPVGTEIRVWYHPNENPLSVSDLDEKGLPWEVYLIVLIGIIFLLAGPSSTK